MAKGPKSKNEGKVPQSALARASRLLLSGVRIAGQEVAGRVAQAVNERPEARQIAQKVRQTRELVETLKQLKGAAMKAGQMLSVEFGDLLPPEVTAVLRQLHDSGSFMPLDQVRFILGRELGRDQLSLLEDLSPHPIAAASIGQVHRAILDGQEVAVKVQFPGIAASIDSDLAVLRRIAGIYLTAAGKNIALDAAFAELTEGFKREVDYRLEAASLERYRAAVTNPAFVVPRVFREFSTERVLTLSYEHGTKLNDWLGGKPTTDQVQAFAELIVTLLVDEFFVNGIVQTDPNYGNFLYRPKVNQLVLLDFGATNEYAAAFRRDVLALMLAAVAGDEAELMRMTFDLDMLDRREPQPVVDAFLHMMRHIAAMFAPQNQPFEFGDLEYLKKVRESVIAFATVVQFSPPAKQVIFLNRKLGGMFHLLKDAGAAVDLHRHLTKIGDTPIS